MQIVHQCTPFLLTQPLYPLLPAPPKRLMLPAPKRPAIAGLLPAVCGGRGHRATPTADQFNEDVDPLASSDSALSTQHSALSFPQPSATPPLTPPRMQGGEIARRVVTLEVANPLQLINIYEDPDAWWEEFERIHGKIKTIEEMDDELEAHLSELCLDAQFAEDAVMTQSNNMNIVPLPHQALKAVLDEALDDLRQKVDVMMDAARRNDGPMLTAIAINDVNASMAVLGARVAAYDAEYGHNAILTANLQKQRDELQRKIDSMRKTFKLLENDDAEAESNGADTKTGSKKGKK